MVWRLVQKNCDIPGMRNPENQVTKRVSTPPEPRKGVHWDALGCLGEETSCFDLFVIVYCRASVRGASQKQKQQPRIPRQHNKKANGGEGEQAPLRTHTCTCFDEAFGEYQNAPKQQLRRMPKSAF